MKFKKLLQSLLISFPVMAFFSYVLFERSRSRFDYNWGENKISQLANTLEYLWYDIKFRAKNPEVAKGVLVARIDDASLERFGRWPWSRAVYSKLLDSLYGLGAEVVGFDAVFSEPEFKKEYLQATFNETVPGSEAPLAKELNLSSEHVDGLTSKLPQIGDLIFGSAAFRHPKTVLGYFWQDESACLTYDPENPVHKKEYGEGLTPAQTRQIGRLHIETLVDSFLGIAPQSVEIENAPVLTTENSKIALFHCPVTNTSGLSAKAKIQGYFNSAPDRDGVFRRSLPLVGFNPSLLNESQAGFLPETWWKNAVTYPSLSLQSLISFWNPAEKAGQVKPILETKANADGKIEVTAIRIPREGQEDLKIETLPDGSFPLNFFGAQNIRPPSIGEFSLAGLPIEGDAMSGHVQSELADEEFRKIYGLDLGDKPLKGQIVIIGPTALGVYDLRPNPVQSNAGGVFLHATAVGRILELAQNATSKYRLFFVDLPVSLAILWILGLILSTALAYATALRGAMGALGMVGVFLIIDSYLFSNQALVLEAMTISLSLVVVFLGIFAYKYFTEERERAFVKGAFEKYVSPDVVGSILDDPKKLNLGGQKKTLSVMFSDVRGFTTISEKMGAAELAKFMNDYLSPMTDIVLANKGTIDKYMGDAIMAIFGAPIEYPNHAQKAVDAALDMLTKLEELKVGWKAQGLPPIDIGVGVNTGEMSVGNMGSTRIFSYTVMGDSVNLGSRLEGINKEYGTHLIVSEFTRADLPEQYVCRELDRVKVKGKLKPVTIYEVMDRNGDPSKRALAQKFETALSLYYKQLFVEAQALFMGLASEDPTSKIYVERCAYWVTEPPEGNWDGSWTMKSK